MTEKIMNPSIKFLSFLLLVILVIAGGAHPGCRRVEFRVDPAGQYSLSAAAI